MYFYIFGAIVIIIFIFLSAAFSFSEMALASSSKVRLKLLLKNGNKRDKRRAQNVLTFIENYNESVTTVVIFNNIVNVFATTLSAYYFDQLLSDSDLIASLISFLIMTSLIILFGELLPKMYAKKYPEKGIMKMSFSIKIIGYIFLPITFLANKLVKQGDTSPIRNEDELRETISEAEKFGVTSKDEIKIINSVLRLDETKASEIMIKKVNVEYVYDDLKKEDYVKFAKKAEVTRIPILDKNGRAQYIWNAKKFLRAYYDNKNEEPKKYFYSMNSYGKNTSANKILKDLKQNRQKIGIIVGKNNILIGIVTIEDIVEIFVGNIYDEFDIQKDGIYKIDSGQYIVNKEVKIMYLFKSYLFNIKLPSNINKSTTIEQWIIKLGKKENKNYVIKPGDRFNYRNIIIWVKKDSNNPGNIIFEIDVV